MWFFKEWYRRFLVDHVFDLSAQLAYYFLVSLFPFLFLIFTLLGYLPISTSYVLQLFQSVAPNEAYHLLENNLIAVLDQKRGDILSLSILIMVWLSSIGIHAIIRVFNQAYQIKESRPFFKDIIVGIMLTVLMILAVISTLLLPVFGSYIGLFIFEKTGLPLPIWHFWEIARYLFSFVILFTLFSMLYRFAPNRTLTLRNVWPGTMFSVLGWHLISFVFSFYVRYFNYGQIYGSLGALLTLMIWFYLSAMILILGGQMNVILTLSSHNKTV